MNDSSIVLPADPDVAAVASIAAIPTLLDMVCRVTGVRVAAVARVTPDRWVACSVRDLVGFGLQAGSELPIEQTFCAGILRTRQPVVFDDATADGPYRDHPLPKLYGIGSYISYPIELPDGTFFGTLCGFDPSPRVVDTDEVHELFRSFSSLIGVSLTNAMRTIAAERQAQTAEHALRSERSDAALREEFIAVLGHDLRNPLAAMGAGLRLLGKADLPVKEARAHALMVGSVQRMSAIIDDVLDYARGRLGEGIVVERTRLAISPVLAQVVDELQATVNDRLIRLQIDDELYVDGDARRIAQAVSNLLGNAVRYGAAGADITLSATRGSPGARGAPGDVWIAVSNFGEPLPDNVLASRFSPFTRGQGGSHREGLGLGLYIAREIAAAHGGELTARSADGQTVFRFRLPAAVGFGS